MVTQTKDHRTENARYSYEKTSFSQAAKKSMMLMKEADLFFNKRQEVDVVETRLLLPKSGFPVGVVPAFVINDPAIFTRVMKDKERYVVARNLIGIAEKIIGENSVLLESGERHKELRRILGRSLMDMRQSANPILEEEATSIVNEIKQRRDAGQRVDVSEFVYRYTLTTAARLFSDTKPTAADISELSTSFDESLRIAFERMAGMHKTLPLGLNFKFKGNIKRMHKIITDLVEDTKNEQTPFGILKNARNNRELTESEFLSNVESLFFAGYETTATSLIWLMYELSKNPQVMETIIAEANVDQPNKKFFESVANEGLRLNPPVPRIIRLCNSEDSIILGENEIVILAQSIVFFSALNVQRNPKYWTDPETFLPARFLDLTSDPKNNEYELSSRFFPFGGGDRLCLGRGLALMQESAFVYALGKIGLRLGTAQTGEITSGFTRKLKSLIISAASETGK